MAKFKLLKDEQEGVVDGDSIVMQRAHRKFPSIRTHSLELQTVSWAFTVAIGIARDVGVLLKMHDQIICIDKASSRVLPRILLSIRTRVLLVVVVHLFRGEVNVHYADWVLLSKAPRKAFFERVVTTTFRRGAHKYSCFVLLNAISEVKRNRVVLIPFSVAAVAWQSTREEY